jgi:ArsR family transcriptional regulator
MEREYQKEVKIFKALSDEHRLKILGMLGNGEKCACVLLRELNIGQSTLSHHMKILCESGLVESRQEGKWTHYSLSAGGCEQLKTLVGNMTKGSRNIKCEGESVCR